MSARLVSASNRSYLLSRRDVRLVPLDPGTQNSTGLNDAFRFSCSRRCRDRPHSRRRHALPCLRCFREVLVHPVTDNTDVHTSGNWLGRTSHRSVLLLSHLSSQWAILPRSSWFPITTRISLNQQPPKLENIYISVYFWILFYVFLLNVKPLLLLFQKNQGLPSAQAPLAYPKSSKHTHKLQPPVTYVSVCLQCECMSPC